VRLILQATVCAATLLLFAASGWCQYSTAHPTWGDFETQGSVTFGYRFTNVTGSQQKFLELYDLKKGPRLMDFSIFGRAKEGTSSFADNYSLTMSGLGGDPFPSASLMVSKDHLYDLRVNFRQSYYYWDRDDSVALPTALPAPYKGHGLTPNQNWATVRRFGSLEFALHATRNLRLGFEFERDAQNGATTTTQSLEYFGDPSLWQSFSRSFPFAVVVPLDELTNRIAGSLDYTWRQWNFHYRGGYQSFNQSLNSDTINMTSLNVDLTGTVSGAANTPLAPLMPSTVAFQETRQLKTPISEFSYSGKVNSRLDIRGGYIFYRYRGPAERNVTYTGTGPTNSAFTTFAPYSIIETDGSRLTEPNHVIDQGFSVRLTNWLDFHTDYRYQRFTEDATGVFHSVRDVNTIADGNVHNQWLVGNHTLGMNLEFVPTRALVIRAGVRLLKSNVEYLVNGVADPFATRQIKTAWPTLSIYYQPSKIFSVRGDFQSIDNGTSYTRISPHTDVGTRFLVRLRPWTKVSVEDSLVVRNRKFTDTNFQNNIRTNATNITYTFSERLSAFGGMSYDSYMATDSVTFLRGVPPLTADWSDRFINRVWQGGIATKAPRYFGGSFTGNLVRTTGLSQISGEPPTFGPVRWPMATATVWAEFPRAGRLSLDFQRSYYGEDIVHANDFQANLLTIRWTRSF
jgi:hypothetical protein